jgi:DNA invertase Pin-like site-specific DNA recombinase
MLNRPGRPKFERELIRALSGEGRKHAQDRGVKFGRPRKLTAHQRQEAPCQTRSGRDAG